MSFDRRRQLLLLGGLAPLLLACGFSPVYGPDGPGKALLNKVFMGPVPGSIGFSFREAITERLGEPLDPVWKLDVSLGVTSEDRVIRQDNSITRYSLTGTATYSFQRVDGAAQPNTGKVTANTGYSATANSFATLAAERDAQARLARALAEELILKLAADVDRNP